LLPVIIAASSPARKPMSAATSSGWANRPTGMSALALSPFSPDHAALPRGVSTTVGETALTVTPRRAHSRESTWVSPTTAALLAQYAAC
jgi:hypothetical protein